MKIRITESKLIKIIEEALPIGKMAARVKKLKNLDSIDRTIKDLENDSDLMETFDEILKEALKKKNISGLETLQARLIHIFAPSNNPDDQKIGKQKASVILNSYALIRKFESWIELKEFIEKGETKKPPEKPKEKPKTSYDSAEYQRMADYYRNVNRKRKEEGKSRHWSPDYDKMADRYRRKKKDYYDDDNWGGIRMESKTKFVNIINELFSQSLVQKLIQKFISENPNINEDTIQYYLKKFQEIKDSPKVKQKDITKYSWIDLKTLIDVNQKKDIDIKDNPDLELIYDQNRLKVFYAPTKNACIKYGNGYNFCISSRGDFNFYHKYAFTEGFTIYFVVDDDRTKERDPILKFKDPYHMIVIMVKNTDPSDWGTGPNIPKYQYRITNANNNPTDTTETYIWNDIVNFQPKLENLKHLFIPRELNPIQEKLAEIENDYIEKIKELNPKYQQYNIHLADKTISEKLKFLDDLIKNKKIDIELLDYCKQYKNIIVKYLHEKSMLDAQVNYNRK